MESYTYFCGNLGLVYSSKTRTYDNFATESGYIRNKDTNEWSLATLPDGPETRTMPGSS